MYLFHGCAHAQVARFILFAAILAFTAGCDNPVEDNHEDHADAHGFILLVDGAEVVRSEDVVVTDTLFLSLGDTTVVAVEFLDEDGDHIHDEDLEDDFELDVASTDPDVVEIVSRDDWSFALRGASADTAVVEVGLLHMPQQHHDLTPREVPVVVR